VIVTGIGRRGLIGLSAAAWLAFAAARVFGQAGARLEIAVLEGDAAAPGISVSIESALLPDGQVVVTTESDGVARLDLESDGLYDVRVEAPGFHAAVLRDVRVSGGETTSVTLELIPRPSGSGSY
jgi:hypothetical protein